MWLFTDSHYGFRSSRSTADPLTVVPDRIARVFNRSGATQAVSLDIPKAFSRVWHAGPLHNIKSYGISGQIFGLILSFLSNRLLREALDGKSLQEYILLILELLKAPFLVLHFSYYTLMTFLIMLSVILLSMLIMLLSTLSVIRHLICGNYCNWLLSLNLVYETLWTGPESGLLISVLENSISFDQSNNTRAIDVKIDGSVLDKKLSFIMLALHFSSKLDWASYII